MNTRGIRTGWSRENTLASIAALIITVLVFGLLISGSALGASENVKREIMVKVKPGIIALPENEVARVPISAARFRSTELRELNNKYNAVNIEKLFRAEKTEKTEEPVRGEQTKVSEPVKEETVDVSKLFTRESRNEMIREGEEAVQEQDTYLIELEFEPKNKINMNTVVNEYKKLDVVSFAKYITRVE
ncbi:MAG: hypothetical protein ABIA66_01695 [Candidatus Omnitrophota bacterium]